MDRTTNRYDSSRKCLAWPYWFSRLGDGAATYRLALTDSQEYDLIVRYSCDVAQSLFHNSTVDEARDRTYKVFLTKVDGNY